jgi:hypothetical protein
MQSLSLDPIDQDLFSSGLGLGIGFGLGIGDLPF